MENKTKERYKAHEALIPGKRDTEWGVFDRVTRKLIERAGKEERYPEACARNRAKQLNEG